MSKAQELIKKEGLVGMIITDPYNMRRISGFRGGEGALYISATQQVLITDSRYTEQAEKESDFTIVQEHRGHTREQIFCRMSGKRRRHTGNRIRRSVAALQPVRQDEKSTSG